MTMAQSSYVARCSICGHIIAACMDTPDATADTAESVSDLILRGFSVQRVPFEEIRGAQWCSCPRPTTATPHPTLNL